MVMDIHICTESLAWGSRDPVDQFTTLPQEVIIEIFRHVHWRDLLHVRQTCKYLCKLSKARFVWLNYYHAYLAEKSFRVGVESPLGSYSSSELESWVLRRKSVDLNWETTTHAARERSISLNETYYVLLPGGRWLLTPTSDGSILCFDLYDVGMRRSILTSPTARSAHASDFIVVDIDQTSPALKFVMAIYCVTPILPDMTENLDIMFWNAELRGHGSSAYLEANFLHSFVATEFYTRGFSASLFGCLFARVLRSASLQYFLEVSNWKLSTSALHYRTLIFPSAADSKKLNSVKLLPDNRLAVISPTSLCVYDIGPITEAQPIPPTTSQYATQPQWSLAYNDPCLSPPRLVDAESVSFIPANMLAGKIYRFAIPLNPARMPGLIEHVNVPQGYVVLVAEGTRALLKKDSVLRKAGFSWNQESITEVGHELVVSRRISQLRSNHLSWFAFDGDMGRIIAYRSRTLFVIDTSFLPL